jgi:hypothetical protein
MARTRSSHNIGNTNPIGKVNASQLSFINILLKSIARSLGHNVYSGPRSKTFLSHFVHCRVDSSSACTIQAVPSMTSGNTAKCCTPIVPVTSPVLDSFDDTTVPEDGLSLQDTPPSDRTIRSTPQFPDPPKIRLLIEVPIHSAYPASSNILTPAQREELHSISAPRDLQYQTEHSPHSASSNYNTCPIYSLDNADNGRKRKAAGDDEDDEDSGNGSHPPVKKTVHSIIENRYRTKLNNEISALRNSVPSLHVVTKSARGEDTAGDREDLLGLTAAHKLNKVGDQLAYL